MTWHCWKLHSTLKPAISSPEPWFSKAATQVAAVTSVQPFMLWILHVLKTLLNHGSCCYHCPRSLCGCLQREVSTWDYRSPVQHKGWSFTVEFHRGGNSHCGEPAYPATLPPQCTNVWKWCQPSNAYTSGLLHCFSQWQKEKNICFSRIKMKKKITLTM